MTSDPQESQFAAFISHSSKDSEFAEEIQLRLEEQGLACWIAPRNVRVGQEYGEEISRGINRSRCLVLVLSSAANESPSVRREVELATKAGKPIFPVRIEDVAPSPKLEFFVSIIQYIDVWHGQLSTHIQTLIDAIEQGEDFVVSEYGKPKGSRFSRGLKLAALATVVVAALLLIGVLSNVQRFLDQDWSTVGDEFAEALEGDQLRNSLETLTDGLAESARESVRGATARQPSAESARDYLSHSSMDSFVERARLDQRSYETLADGRCRIPAYMSSPNPAVVVAAWEDQGQSGLQPGDRFLRINDQPVAGSESGLMDELAEYRPGDTLRIAFDRNNNEVTRSVVCAETPARERTLMTRMLENAMNRNWRECLEAAVTAEVWLGELARTAFYQAHCARYAGMIGQAQWNERIYEYYKLLINEAALSGVNDLEDLWATINDPDSGIATDLGRYHRFLNTIYQTAVSSVTRP